MEVTGQGCACVAGTGGRHQGLYRIVIELLLYVMSLLAGLTSPGENVKSTAPSVRISGTEREQAVPVKELDRDVTPYRLMATSSLSMPFAEGERSIS